MQASISFKFNKGIYHPEKFVRQYNSCSFQDVGITRKTNHARFQPNAR
jgi:hypothetical protein